MSRPTNNLALTNSDIIFKTFVKEKNETNVEIEDKHRSKLAFHGHQAKLAYDEIITHVKSQENQRKCVPQTSCSTSRTIEPKLKNIQIKNVNSKERNINLLFKAIESGDIGFISQNFDSENVNMSDQFGWTPLMSAAYSGHIEIVNFLLKLGANTKIKDKSGLTAMELAMRRNHLDIINLLKQRFHKKKDNSSREGVPGSSKNNMQRVDVESFYCDVCKIVFTESSRLNHETSTLHIFNGNPKLRNAYYGIPRQNKGYQILLNTGWDEENGLGPSGEGQKYPVKTILKRDRKGLGQEKKDTPRVTHFEPRDTEAVKFVNRHKRKARTKRDLVKQMKRDAAKTRAWRNSMS